MSRSLWKPVTAVSSFKSKSKGAQTNVYTYKRSAILSKDRRKSFISVYTGVRWQRFYRTQEKIGCRVGEFAPTRQRPVLKKKKKKK